jgi:hypothetical protein
MGFSSFTAVLCRFVPFTTQNEGVKRKGVHVSPSSALEFSGANPGFISCHAPPPPGPLSVANILAVMRVTCFPGAVNAATCRAHRRFEVRHPREGGNLVYSSLGLFPWG